MPVTVTAEAPLSVPLPAVERAAAAIPGLILNRATCGVPGSPCLSVVVSRPGDSYRFLARLGAELAAAAPPADAGAAAELAAEIAARAKGINHKLAALVYFPHVTVTGDAIAWHPDPAVAAHAVHGGLEALLWAEGDPADYSLSDALQHLGNVAFRAPVPAYKHSAAAFLHLVGRVPSPRAHPGSPLRPPWEGELLRDCAALLASGPAALVLTTYAIRASALATDALVRECMIGRRGTTESGELAVIEEAGGRLLPTSLVTRWSSDGAAA